MSRFAVGDRVTIREQQTLFHLRVPAYAQGRSGIVERILPEFVLPEDDAWGRLWNGGRRATLYRVRLYQQDIWPDYRGPVTDTIELEIFENWLTPAEEATT
jgi:thiocyanate hydrolase subunit alpha